ncbi:zinc finger protein 471-like [Argonauta hians]
MKDEFSRQDLYSDRATVGDPSKTNLSNGILFIPQATITSSSSSSSSAKLPPHSGSHNSFTCDICGKTLSRRDHLKLHKTIHTGARPYRCETCGCAFSRNHHLVRHMSSHLSEKKFKCDICGKSLSRSDHLKVHRRIHTGERPFKCQICGFAFSRRDRLVKHNQLTKGKRKLSCVPPAFSPAINESPDSSHTVDNTASHGILGNSGSVSTPLSLNSQQNNKTNESVYIFVDRSSSNSKEGGSHSVQARTTTQSQDQQERIKSDSSDVKQRLAPAEVSELSVSGANCGPDISPSVFPIQMTPAIYPALQMYSNTTSLNIIPSSHVFINK